MIFKKRHQPSVIENPALRPFLSRWVLMSWSSCALTSSESAPTTLLRCPRDRPSRRPEDTSRPGYICRGRTNNRSAHRHVCVYVHYLGKVSFHVIFFSYLQHRTADWGLDVLIGERLKVTYGLRYGTFKRDLYLLDVSSIFFFFSRNVREQITN